MLVERGDVSGKTGKTTLLHDLPGVSAPRVLVVGLGDTGKFGVPQYLKAVGDAARAQALLEDIVRNYPGSPFAQAAASELRTFEVSRDLKNFLPGAAAAPQGSSAPQGAAAPQGASGQ